MATTNHYDLIVLGADIAGLVAAALAARRGKRVLVIPHGPAEATYRLGRETFPLQVAPLIHLGCATVRRVYEELGLWTQLRRERRSWTELVHWIHDDHRLDLGPAMEGWEREARREWPTDPVVEASDLRRRWTEASNELLDHVLAGEGALTADGFWGRRFLGRVAESLPPSTLDELEPLAAGHPLRASAHALEPWYLHLTPEQVGKSASLRLAELWARGPDDRHGGEPALRAQLLQRVQLKSGDVKPALRVAEVLIKRGKVIGVSLLGKRDRYGCDQMLIASDPRAMLDAALLPQQLPKPLVLTLEGLQPVAHRFVMHLEVTADGLSPALAGLVICMPLSGENVGRHGVGTTYLRLGERTADGARRLTITRILDARHDTTRAREMILDELDRRGVLPFVHDHLRFVHSPHDGREATDGRGSPTERHGTATAMRLPMSPIYRSGSEPTLGIGVLPHSSGIKNLYFASRLTFPGLGLEGEFAAGWAAAGAIAASGRSGLGRNLFIGRG